MKTVIMFATLITAVALVSSCSKKDLVEVNDQNKIEIIKSKETGPFIGVTIRLYRPKRDCLYGVGLCEFSGAFFGWEWDVVSVPTSEPRSGIILDDMKEYLTIEFADPIDTSRGTVLNISTDDLYPSIDSNILDSLGVSSLELIEGDYQINFDDSYFGYGNVTVPVVTE